MNYLRSAWRNLAHNKYYTLINITGLGVAIAACILIGLFVHHELSFDKKIPDVSRVYRLNEYLHYDGTAPQLSASSGAPIPGLLKSDHPEIESYARVFPATPFIYQSITLSYEGNKIKAAHMVCTDTVFKSVFGIDIVEGDRNSFIRDKNNIALTQTMATRLFGSQSPLNKAVKIIVDDSTTQYFTVSQVVRDLPSTSHLQAEGFLPIPREFEESFTGQSWGSLLGPTYIKLKPGVNDGVLQSGLTATIHTKNKGIDLQLQPVANIHTGSSDINYDYFNYNKVNGRYINIFVIVALAIFLIACCNFINLTIAIAAYRGKEIAVKKIMGAGRLHILLQILSESFLSVLGAVLLAILLATIFLPFMNGIIGRELSVSSLYGWQTMIICIAVIAITSLVAGIYPALLISASKVSQALKTKVLFGGSRTSLRNVLVTGQFAVAVCFIASLVVFMQQLKFIQEKDLGYAYEQVMKIPLDAQSASKLHVLSTELKQVKGVNDVTIGKMELGDKGDLFGIEYTAPDGTKKNVSVNFENGAPNYTGFFDMKIVAGRTFQKDNPNNEYLVNETLARNIGYSDPIGKPIHLTSFPPGRIVGVVKDFNYSSLHTRIEPLLISSIDYVPVWQSQLYVKVAAAGIQQTVQEITAKLRSVTGDRVLSPEFLDEHFKQTYNAERQAGTIIAVIGVLAITIACLGLFGLAAFVIIKRAKEIGIRKVLGASVAAVVTTLSREFIRLVAIAFVIATPVTWWLASKWLQGFAYRTSVQWWMFALAGGAAVVIAFVTVGVLALRAARVNPVKSLRTE